MERMNIHLLDNALRRVLLANFRGLAPIRGAAAIQWDTLINANLLPQMTQPVNQTIGFLSFLGFSPNFAMQIRTLIVSSSCTFIVFLRDGTVDEARQASIKSQARKPHE